MQILFIFILIFFFGYLASWIISKSLSLLERIGLSYLLGLGLTTLLLFCFSWLGVKITKFNIVEIVSLSLSFILFGLFLMKRGVGLRLTDLQKIFSELNKYEKIILVLIGIMFLSSFMISFYYPVYVWDALALYDFTGKIVAQTGYFTQIASQFFYFAQYPLLVSLGHTIVYLFGGANPQFIYPIYLISFALIFFSFVRRESGRFLALLATMVLVTNPTLFAHSTIAYTNLPYTAFYAAGILFLAHGIVHDKKDYLFLSSILIGLSTWARAVEPFWLAEILIILGYSFYKKSIYPLLIFLLPLLLIRMPWSIFQAKLYGGFYSTSGQISLLSPILNQGLNFKRILDVSIYLYQSVVASWGPLFALFLIALFIMFTRKIIKRDLVLLLIIVANFLLLFTGTYIFSIRFPEWKEIPDSAVRISMFFPPLMIYFISLILGAKSSLSKTKPLT